MTRGCAVAAMPKRTLIGWAEPMADTCRCHLPVDPPLDLPHWWPCRDPEPAKHVVAVAMYGQQPAFLRRVRVPGGWHTQGGWGEPSRCHAAEAVGGRRPLLGWRAARRRRRHSASRTEGSNSTAGSGDYGRALAAGAPERAWLPLSRRDHEQFRPWLTWMTCALDGLEHAVTDEAFAVACRQDSGIYRAVCGHMVAVLPMISPPGRRCRACVQAERGRHC